MIVSIFAKAWGRLYKVELEYKVNGLFVLRPVDGKPYQWLTATAEQVRAMRLFPIIGGV